MPDSQSLREQNRLLIYRCFNVLNRQAELSGPQVMLYLMNWGDKLTSHQYVSVYWFQLENALKEVYPHLDSEHGLDHASDRFDGDGICSKAEGGVVSFRFILMMVKKKLYCFFFFFKGRMNENMRLFGDSEGKLRVQRQVEDYAYCGVEFEMMWFLTFIVETYECRMKKETTSVEKGFEEEVEMSSGSEKGQYLNGHSRRETHVRVGRPDGHNMLPNIVGPWLPHRDGDESTRPFYFAAMLAFLKPWRDLNHLKGNANCWETAFEGYMSTTTQRDKDFVAGCQYYYDTRSAIVDDKAEDWEDDEMHMEGAMINKGIEEEEDDIGLEENVVSSVSNRFYCQIC